MVTVIGLFDHFADADRAVEALENFGIDTNRISVVTQENNRVMHGTPSAGTGAVTGAAAGGLVGLLAGLSALVIPGIGPVIAAGAIGTALATTVGMTAVGAGVGAATGGLLGALIHSGFSQEDAEFYAEGVKRGGVLVYVETDSQYENRAREILRGAGAVDTNSRRKAWQGEGWTGYTDTDLSSEENYQRDNMHHN